MTNKTLADEILNSALHMADTGSWENTHLYEVAENLNISLDQIKQYYPQKDDVVEAWFDRADSAVLSIAPTQDFMSHSETERLQTVIMTWLDTLAPFRRVTREMLYYKLEFGHIHLQVLGILRISRTVQWFREAAHQQSTNLRRILEEIATTQIYLITFSRWLFDDSQESEKTRQLLGKMLKQIEFFTSRLII